MESFVFKGFTGKMNFISPCFVKGDIGPSTKDLLQVPGCLTVAHQIYFCHMPCPSISP
jgi:hypothetical protein